MVGPASSLFQATLTVTTGLSAPFNNLAIIYKQQVAWLHAPLYDVQLFIGLLNMSDEFLFFLVIFFPP